MFRRHELEKKREYGDRVRSVESASFTPLVFSTFGGLGREATIFYVSIVALPTCLLYDITFSTVKCYPGCAVPSLSPYLAIRESRTLNFAERPSISTELCLVESHIDFTV